MKRKKILQLYNKNIDFSGSVIQAGTDMFSVYGSIFGSTIRISLACQLRRGYVSFDCDVRVLHLAVLSGYI